MSIEYYDNNGFSDDILDVDEPTGTPEKDEQQPQLSDKDIQEIDRRVKKLVNEGSRSTDKLSDWAEKWVSVSSTWWRDYAKASGYTDEEPEKQKERTLPGNFGEAMPEYFLADDRRAEIRRKFQGKLPQSAREAVLSQGGLDGKLWLHDYVNIPLEAFKAIAGEDVAARSDKTLPNDGSNKLYTRVVVCGHPGVKVVSKTSQRVVVDSKGIKLTFSGKLSNTDTEPQVHMYFSSECTVAEAFEALAKRKGVDTSTLKFYNEVDVHGKTQPLRQEFAVDDKSKLWDTNMAIKGNVKVEVKGEEKPPQEAEPEAHESGAEDSDIGTPAAPAAAAETPEAAAAAPSKRGNKAPSPLAPGGDKGNGGGERMECANDCYAISLLRALFAASKFCSSIKTLKTQRTTAAQKDLLDYLDSINAKLYTLKHLPFPRKAGDFLSLLKKGEQQYLHDAFQAFVKQLGTTVFRTFYDILTPTTRTHGNADGITWEDNPSLSVQSVIERWLYYDPSDESGQKGDQQSGEPQVVLPYQLPDVFVVSLQKSRDQKKPSTRKNRCQFDSSITLPEYENEELPNIDFETGKQRTTASVNYQLVAVAMHVGLTEGTQGEFGHYVVVFKRPGEERWTLLDNMGTYSTSFTAVKDKPLKLEGSVTQGTISMTTLFYERTGW